MLGINPDGAPSKPSKQEVLMVQPAHVLMFGWT
jgi:hypothetical protein